MTTPRLAEPIAISRDPASARRQVESLLRDHAWTTGVDEVGLAVHEALVNTHRHAGGALRAEACVGQSSLRIEVRDRGPGFDPAPFVRRRPDPMAERGRGLWLISRIASSWDVHREGEEVTLTMRFNRR